MIVHTLNNIENQCKERHSNQHAIVTLAENSQIWVIV
jgi:hypothetical protein